MTIIRSIGATTLVALMSVHRMAIEQGEPTSESFEQARIYAIEAYLQGETERPGFCQYPTHTARH